MESPLISNELRKLIKSSNLISYSLSLIVLLIYFLFISILGFAPELFKIYILNTSITIGIALGLTTIILSIFLTFIYVMLSNLYLDQLKKKIKK
ncbi:MAG: hypothetical protein CMM95_01870 [Rickettsiales bacterium]|nr:hypothetical protein [Rickettsiales bacterium]|tara:strand:+ start:154 stop:435 length:282 start_codon:yes stop_codon:yes gene_type:complete